jgi:hypothetical protein
MHSQKLAVVALACLPLAAQTFVVDLNNGPGTNYTSLAAAVAGVPGGAVLRVRAGTYGEAITIAGKSLTILGEPGALLMPPAVGGFHIDGLAANQTVVLRGLEINFTQTVDPTIRCANNQGLIVLDGVSSVGRTNLFADSCAALQVRDSVFGVTPFATGLGSINLTNCIATFEHCGAADVRLTNSSVQFANCELTGNTFVGAVYNRAVIMAGGDLRLLGGSLTGGQSLTLLQAQAIQGAGNVRVDPSTVVIASVPRFDPGVIVTTLEMPKVTSQRVNGGADLQATMTGPAGGTGVLMLALAVPAVTIPNFDPRWMDGATLTVQAIGVLGGTPLQSTFTLPPTGVFTGLLITHQGLAASPSGSLSLSNPATQMID